MIESFKNKGLAELFAKGSTRRIDARMPRRILIILEALDQAATAEAMNVPGLNFHALRGFDPSRYTVHVNGPWCVTSNSATATLAESTMSSTTETGTAMTEYPAIRDRNRPPAHPGEMLREIVLDSLGMSVSEAANRLGVTRQTLHRILAGTTSVTPEMALRLGRFCGNGPDLWLRMQVVHDLWHAERNTRAEIEAIKPAA
jgi:addiction module HigA family antidote